MDLMTGLSALSTATDLVKKLRDIERSSDEAAFKLAIAELQENLADAKISLSEARVMISEKTEEIKELQKKIRELEAGDICPVCRVGNLKTVMVTPHRQFGDLGVQEKHLECSNEDCPHEERRFHDPMGRLGK